MAATHNAAFPVVLALVLMLGVVFYQASRMLQRMPQLPMNMRDGSVGDGMALAAWLAFVLVTLFCTIAWSIFVMCIVSSERDYSEDHMASTNAHDIRNAALQSVTNSSTFHGTTAGLFSAASYWILLDWVVTDEVSSTFKLWLFLIVQLTTFIVLWVWAYNSFEYRYKALRLMRRNLDTFSSEKSRTTMESRT